MSTRTIHTPFHAGDLISERTARRARAHPRTVAAPDAAPAPAPATDAARRDTPSPAGDARILRRWSVAALIASAPRPRALA